MQEENCLKSNNVKEVNVKLLLIDFYIKIESNICIYFIFEDSFWQTNIPGKFLEIA